MHHGAGSYTLTHTFEVLCALVSRRRLAVAFKLLTHVSSTALEAAGHEWLECLTSTRHESR